MVKRAGKLKMRGVATNAIKRGLILSGMLVAQRATRRAPRLTGRLKRSITHGKPYKRKRTRWAIDVGTNVEYAAAQELGSGIHAEGGGGQPYPIRPVKKKALAFVWPDHPPHIEPDPETGKVVLAKVMHPGVKPQPYLRPALNESIPEIKGLLLHTLIVGLRRL